MDPAFREQYDRYETEYLIEMSTRELTDDARAALDSVLQERRVMPEAVSKSHDAPFAQAAAQGRLASLLARALAVLSDCWGTMFFIGLVTLPVIYLSVRVYSALAFWIWFAYFLSKDWIPGSSIGKRALGIRVVSIETGKPCKWTQSAMRNLTALFLPFEWITVFGRRRMRCGDMFAGTEVIRRVSIVEPDRVRG